MEFSEILRNLIENHDITQKKLAQDLNLAPSTIGSYVQGVREPDFKTIKQLANYFQVSIDYLLDYRSKKTDTYMEDELLRIFRSLPIELQELYIEQGKVMLKLNNKRISPSLNQLHKPISKKQSI